MMAKFEFDLKDEEDRESFNQMQKCFSYRDSLIEFSDFLRNLEKYESETWSDDWKDVLNRIRAEFFNIINSRLPDGLVE